MMRTGWKPASLAMGFACAFMMVSTPASADPFAGLKKIANKLERVSEEADEVRQRAEDAKRTVDSLASAVGIERDRPDPDRPEAHDGDDREAMIESGREYAVPYAPQASSEDTTEEASDDGWPPMEAEQDMEGNPQ